MYTMDTNNNLGQLGTKWKYDNGKTRQFQIPRRKLSHLVSRLLMICVLFLLTFGAVLPRYCSDWVYSVYFRGDARDKQYVERALDKNTQRLYWAQEYFSQLGEEDLEESQEPRYGKVDLAVVIIGMQRQLDNYNPNYILQTAASVHKQFKEDNAFSNKKLFICDVDKEREARTALDGIKPYVNVVSRFGGEFPGEKVAKDIWDKSKEDYAFCMDRAMDLDPKYVLVLEDDITLRPGFFNLLHTQLYTNAPIAQASPASEGATKWAYIKLYYPPKWAGYSRDFRHFAELLGIMICGGAIFVFIRVVMRVVFKQRHQNYATTPLWFLVGAVYFLCLSITIGRPYVVDFVYSLSQHSHLIPARDCCTQAVVYHKDVVWDITAHLSNTRSTGGESHDIIMDRWVDNNGYARYLSEPNLVHHIGLVSTVRVSAKKAAEFIY